MYQAYTGLTANFLTNIKVVKESTVRFRVTSRTAAAAADNDAWVRHAVTSINSQSPRFDPPPALQHGNYHVNRGCRTPRSNCYERKIITRQGLSRGLRYRTQQLLLLYAAGINFISAWNYKFHPVWLLYRMILYRNWNFEINYCMFCTVLIAILIRIVIRDKYHELHCMHIGVNYKGRCTP